MPSARACRRVRRWTPLWCRSLGICPGYDCQVIMAAGAFTLGASIELSADAPLREPYAAWMQGGLNFHSGKLGAMLAAQSMLEKGLLSNA